MSKLKKKDLIEWLREMEVTQKEFAKYLEVSPSFVSGYINGYKNLPEDKVEKTLNAITNDAFTKWMHSE